MVRQLIHIPYLFYVYSLPGLFKTFLNLKLELFIRSPNIKIYQSHNYLISHFLLHHENAPI